MSMSTSKANTPNKSQEKTQTDAQIEKQRAEEQGSNTSVVKAEGNTISLNQDGIQKEIREVIKANFESWKEDSSDVSARDQFNSQATSIAKSAGLQGTRPRLSESGDKLEFDA